MQPALIIAPEVERLLDGGTAAILQDLTVGQYRCGTCGDPGDLDDEHPATVIVIVHNCGAGPNTVQLAHPRCTGSVARVTTQPPGAPADIVDAAAWIRPSTTNPPSVLIIAPSMSPISTTPSGDTINKMLAWLLEAGFALLRDPAMPLPVVPSLTAHHAEGRITIRNTSRKVFWDGALDTHPAWGDGIDRAGRVGVTVLANTRLGVSNPNCALGKAIADGRAVGGAVVLATGH